MIGPVPPFAYIVEAIGFGIDLLGVAAIVVGIATAVVLAVRRRRSGVAATDLYTGFRRDVGRAVLLGLELLVAGDILRTVAIEPTLESVGVLAAIVLVRTFLSFSLEIELYGQLPWKRESLRDGAG